MNHHALNFFVLLFTLVVLVNISSVQAAIEVNQFDNSQQQVRYQHLIAELRCLVCQNQNLADSNAELAKDLRNKTLGMIKSGKTNKQILSYMQERYGDFVLYRPPFNTKTAVLWTGPFVLLIVTLLLLFINITKKRSITSPLEDDIHDEAINQARLLLNKNNEKDKQNKDQHHD